MKSTGTVKKCSPSTGRMSRDGMTYALGRDETPSASTLFAAAIRAKRTVQLSAPINQSTRVSAVSSSALLMRCAQELWSAKIRRMSEGTLPGLGGDSELALNRLVTLACPSDCERVALALSTSGSECSCSPKWRTPTATDWKGGKRRTKHGTQKNLRDQWTQTFGSLYMPAEALEVAQGFPAGWTELDAAETPSYRKSQSSSEG